jgi:Rne/Rng family ribonuclease
MSKELVISANRHETKVAILEDDQLVEVFFQRTNEYSLAGSIHKGRVTRVLPGMQSAFVDLGLERDTFLYVSDFFEENEEFDRIPVAREDSGTDQLTRSPAEPPTEPDEPLTASEPNIEISEGALGTPTSAAAAAPVTAPQERYEGGDRDRRGRRPRRRRNRGRGFPESKYASSDSRSASDAPRETAREPREPREPHRESRTVEAVPAVESGSPAPAGHARGSDFAVLPGESLAKYARANIQPLDDAEEEEIRSLQESDSAPESETQTSTILAGAEASPAPDPEPEVASTAEEQAEEEAEETDVVDLASEIQAAAEAEVAAEAESAAVENEAQPTEITGAGAAQSDPPTPQLTAQVREQGGRYPHRMTRRMRRKMRGGPQGERGERERGERSEPAPAAVEGFSRQEQPRTISRPERGPMPSITELLKEGQEIIVQIAKEPLGQKGARITSHIALPGRYVVYMPTLEHTGVSRKIASDDERHRLKRILQIHHAGIPGGFIVRTAGEGKREDEIAADMNFLGNLWLDIRQKAEKKPAPILLHHDLDIVQRILRDQVTDQFKAVWVDNEELYESVLSFVQRFQPGLVNRVKLYTRSAPIFDAFNITAELEKALRPKVWLKSGGYIVINQTEALVAIDVNTGKYVGRSNRLEDTIVKTNTEAVKEIVRQIRLRDLGGIIVVDFIDMDERKNRQKVMQALEDAMRADRAPYKILQFNDFGLVAITRKRVKQSLERALCMPCPHCEGAGYVKSVQTIVSEILQEAHKIAGAVEGKDVMLRAHPEVAKFLKSNTNRYLEEIEEVLRRPVLVKGDPLLHHEKFDLT